MKEGDQYAITGNDRFQLFMQRANAYQKEGALVFALNDLNAAVRLNRDFYITGEYSIKVTRLCEELAKQIRIGQIDPEFPPFMRNDHIYNMHKSL